MTLEKRVFKTREFSRQMKKIALSDRDLCDAVEEMGRGLIDADLGGGVYKKRVALPGRGKSSSTRTLLATNRGDRWFFLYGFEKNQKSNITQRELEYLRALAEDYLSIALPEKGKSVAYKNLEEICNEKEKSTT